MELWETVEVGKETDDEIDDIREGNDYREEIDD